MENNIIRSVLISHEYLKNIITDWILEYYDRNIDSGESSALEVLDQFVEAIKKECFFLLEFPYVEKYYRDLYYNYFSTKHSFYDRNTIRVNIFSKQIKFKDIDDHLIAPEDYLGFFTLRPTFPNIIGQSYINPLAFDGLEHFEVAKCMKTAVVNGNKFSFNSFPYSNQDAEYMTCAETSLSHILNYFGSRYPDYLAPLPSKILSSTQFITQQRQTPSTGLTFEQISYLLREFGFGTIIYDKLEFEDDFYSLIAIYIDSKIPLIAGWNTEDNKEVHSIVIIGQECIDRVDFSGYSAKSKLTLNENNVTFIDEIKRKFVIMDDNVPPYRIIKLSSPSDSIGYPDNEKYSKTKFYSIIVPLYWKIYRDVTKAKFTFLRIIENSKFGNKYDVDILVRTFLTSSSSYKHYIYTLEGFDMIIKRFVLQMNMPRFIWVAEIYDAKSFPNCKEAIGLIVTDSTDPVRDLDIEDVLFFACYPEKTIFIDSKHGIQNDMAEEGSQGATESESLKSLVANPPSVSGHPGKEDLGTVIEDSGPERDFDEKSITLRTYFKKYIYYNNY